MTPDDRSPAPDRASLRDRLHPLAAKVPEITLLFWVLKLLTTGMGEAMSDFLGQKSIPLAAAVGLLGVALAFAMQFAQRAYRAPQYWFAVMMVAVFGTMAADGVRRGAGVTYAVTTPLFALATAAIFALWYRSEGTLSIHSITTRRRETFYWAAVLSTFALGTAAGDLTAFTLHLGFFASILLFAAIIAVPAVGWRRGALNPTVAFWASYVVTRPLGASIADWFAKPTRLTGLGVGDAVVSAVAFAVFIALVAYAAASRRDVQRSEGQGHAHGHATGLDSNLRAAPAEQ